ncbi:MAG TPA: hypothetical protein VMU99_07000 [Acidimicrobiales bacterium]|nr:hypothetical protein [Acidimicrobiales bacterium]
MPDRFSVIHTERSDAVARLGRWLGLLRCAIGVSALVAPTLPATPWVGRVEAERSSVRLFTRTLGGRDLALGLGAVLAPDTSQGLSSWTSLGALADAGDFFATAVAFNKLPKLGRWLILTTTLMAAIVGAGLGLLLSARERETI